MQHVSGFAGGGGSFGTGATFGGRIYGGWYRRRHGRRHALILFTVLSVAFLVLVLSLSLALGTEPHTIRSSEVYGLTDNRLISYRGDFCVNLRATSTQEPRDLQSSATLSFLSSRPALTGREIITLFESASLNAFINFNSWNFYLNFNSNISIEVCYRQSSSSINDPVTYFLIKGTDDFEVWLEDPEESRRPIRSIRLNDRCTSISYRVVGDDVYYFVFYFNGRHSTVVDIDFRFDRTLYEVSSDMVVKNCTFALDGRSQCTLDAPMTPGYTGFLSLSATPPVNYNDGAGISISCSPRGWLYAVIVLAVFLVAGCLLCGCVAFCVWTTKKDASRAEDATMTFRPSTVTPQSIPLRDNPSRSSDTTESVPVTDQPPAIPANSCLFKEEPPSYSDAVQYSISDDAPPPPSYAEL